MTMSIEPPIPKMEDLFVTLAHGKTFIKLDMNHASIQLNEDLKKYMVINTHKAQHFGYKTIKRRAFVEPRKALPKNTTELKSILGILSTTQNVFLICNLSWPLYTNC